MATREIKDVRYTERTQVVIGKRMADLLSTLSDGLQIHRAAWVLVDKLDGQVDISMAADIVQALIYTMRTGCYTYNVQSDDVSRTITINRIQTDGDVGVTVDDTYQTGILYHSTVHKFFVAGHARYTEEYAGPIEEKYLTWLELNFGEDE